MSKRLANKTAIVTGAASGIGEAIATLFAQEGARVAIVDVQADAARAVQARIGANSVAIPADLSDRSATASVVPTAVEALGGVDILVNNAGLYGWINKKSITDTAPEVWDRTLEVNVTAPYLLARDVIPVMTARGGGSIINIASIGGLEAFPEFAAYAVSKSALIQLTKSIALDFGPVNIRANALCPGAIDTPGNDPFIENREEYETLIKSMTPIRQLGQPMDVAWAAVYLASDESRYVTGATLIIDGGRMAQA